MKQENQRRKKGKRRSRIKKIGSMAGLVVVLSVGIWGTMAYLSTVSDVKSNTFTGSKGISLKLTETYWNDDDGTTDIADAVDNDGTNLGVTKKGEEAANEYTPGTRIAKNPVLTNNSNQDSQEWVAMVVTYKAGTESLTYTQLQYLLEEIEFNTTESTQKGYWIPIGPFTSGTTDLDPDQKYRIYMYNRVLEKDSATEPLFSYVDIKDSDALDGSKKDGEITELNNALGITEDAQKYKINGNLPAFQIDVLGAAIKNEYETTSNTLAKDTSDLTQVQLTEIEQNLYTLLQSKVK